MSMTSKLWPMESGICVVEVYITPSQLRQEAKGFLIHLTAAGISPVGLHFEDFVPVVLRRRMENLVIEAKRLGFQFRGPNLHLPPKSLEQGYDPPEEEGPGLQFFLPNEADAVNFKVMLL